jgi:hypothetical protein
VNPKLVLKLEEHAQVTTADRLVIQGSFKNFPWSRQSQLFYFILTKVEENQN